MQEFGQKKSEKCQLWCAGGARGTKSGENQSQYDLSSGDQNICTKFHGNPSNRCWDVSVWTKVVHWSTLQCCATAWLKNIMCHMTKHGKAWFIKKNKKLFNTMFKTCSEYKWTQLAGERENYTWTKLFKTHTRLFS